MLPMASGMSLIGSLGFGGKAAMSAALSFSISNAACLEYIYIYYI